MTSAAVTAAEAQLCGTTDGPKRRGATRPGPVLHTNSLETKRLATAILEVLAGVRTPADAAQTLNISLPRYYLLEQRAVTGLLVACEARSKGRQRSVEREITKLERALASSQRECSRQQALLRATQRAVGLTAMPPSKAAEKNGGKKTRRRRPTARALRAARAIAINSCGTLGPDGVQPSVSSGGDGSDAVAPPYPSQP